LAAVVQVVRAVVQTTELKAAIHQYQELALRLLHQLVVDTAFT
jgi:hypothetical protein